MVKSGPEWLRLWVGIGSGLLLEDCYFWRWIIVLKSILEA